jgi:hypothetical protein
MGIYNFHRFCMASSALFFAGLAVFLYRHGMYDGGGMKYKIFAVMSAVVAVAIVPYLIKFSARLNALKHATNLICLKCEYDLRGTIAAGIRKCPECATPIPDEMMAMGKLF